MTNERLKDALEELEALNGRLARASEQSKVSRAELAGFRSDFERVFNDVNTAFDDMKPRGLKAHKPTSKVRADILEVIGAIELRCRDVRPYVEDLREVQEALEVIEDRHCARLRSLVDRLASVN